MSYKSYYDNFGHKLSFRKEKNPNTTTLKLEHLPVSLNIFSIKIREAENTHIFKVISYLCPNFV